MCTPQGTSCSCGPAFCKCGKEPLSLKKQLILISSPCVDYVGFLENDAESIKKLLSRNEVKTVLFLPYASEMYDTHYKKVKAAFKKWDYEVESIHNLPCPCQALDTCQAIYVGGGNSYLLLKTLYDLNLMCLLRKRVLEDGVPYIGACAGATVAARNIGTTLDMPIVHPPSLEALNFVPFNIYVKYTGPIFIEQFKGEVNDMRICEYRQQNEDAVILALRPGCTLIVDELTATLAGNKGAKVFRKQRVPVEYTPGDDMSFLLKVEYGYYS